MNVLIYIEPLIEVGAPLAKSYWVNRWLPRISESIREAYGPASKVTLLGGTTFLDGLDLPDISIIAIDPLKILDLWKFNPDQILMQALRSQRSPSAIMLAESIKCYIPQDRYDVVIVFGTQGYHRTIFPNTPILYHEFSFFKAPGPDTWYFDPVGPGGSAWINKHWESFKRSWKPTDHELALSKRYRDTYRSIILDRGIAADTIREFSSKFTETILLPLQMDGTASFAAFSPMQSQFNLALGVRQSLPESVGLIITEHPRQMGGLNDDGRAYLKSLDNILIVHQGGEFGPSDEVAPYVDGVATITSTVGALSILWNKSLISVSGRYMTPFADHVGPPPWPLTERKAQDDLSLLAFLMTRWAVPVAQIEDPEWMHGLLSHVLKRAAGLVDPSDSPIPIWQTSPENFESAWFAGLA